MSHNEIDEGINTVSNQLIELRRAGAKQRAEHEFELMKLNRRQDQLNHQWEGQIKPNKSSSKSSCGVHQEVVATVFGQADDGNDNDGDGDKKDSTMSPFLLSRLSQLCYHIHLMTQGETFVNKIHEDNRVVVNWLHEVWEKLEREKEETLEKIQNIQSERKSLIENHEQKLLLLKQKKLTMKNNNNASCINNIDPSVVFKAERTTTAATKKNSIPAAIPTEDKENYNEKNGTSLVIAS